MKLLCVVTGQIGIGKTTIINNICRKIGDEKCEIVPEYIDGLPDGQEMLEKYLSGAISTYTFQQYIMDYYSKSVSEASRDIILCERCPDDAVKIFCKKDLKNGKMDKKEYKLIKEESSKINIKIGFPSYYRLNKSVFIPLKSDDSDVCSSIIVGIIKSCLSVGVERVVIGLYESPRVCFERIIKRNRNGEAEGYNIKDIEEINKLYESLYTKLSKH